jgi:alpha-1,3-rhamnosyl/mannosyltransferase
MACGTPVIASRGSSIEENLGGAATLVPSTDPCAIARGLQRLLTADDERGAQIRLGLDRAATFEWARTAALVANCYRELANRVSSRTRP